MNKKLIVLNLLFLIVFVGGCYNVNIENKNTLKGDYQSVRGVMNQLSCYCFNAGYLESGDGEKIPVCFEDNEKK